MLDKNIYVIAKIFDAQGCIAYRCKTANEARCLPGTLEALRGEGVQIVILDSPEIYAAYEPYNYVEDMKEFFDFLNRIHFQFSQSSRIGTFSFRGMADRKWKLLPGIYREFITSQKARTCDGYFYHNASGFL